MKKKYLILPIILSLITFLSADTTDTFQQKSEEEQDTQKRKCHFMFSTDFFWHKALQSTTVTAGPCLNLGIETVRNNYFGINYYWGPIHGHDHQTYGGGAVYKHTFRLGKLFMVSPGVQAGYWNVHWLNWHTGDKGKDHFFGGPLLSFNIGHDRVCFKPEFFLSIGTGGVIPTYSVGANFRVKKSTRDWKNRFIFSTDSKSTINLNKDDSLGMSEESWHKYNESGLSFNEFKRIRALKGVYLIFISIGVAGVTEGLVWLIIASKTKDDPTPNEEHYVPLGFSHYGMFMCPALIRATCFLIPGLLLRRKVRRIKENSKKISLNPGFNPINGDMKLSLTYDF